MQETERLIIREFIPDDGEFILKLLNTPSWIRFIGNRNINNIDDAIKYLEIGPLKSYREHGFGLNCVLLKNGNIPIGMCGLIKRDSLEFADIGFAFLPGYEGMGYAIESAVSVLEQAKKLNMSRVLAVTLPDNERSIRLLKKLNMCHDKMIKLPGGNEELMLFSIDLTK